MAERGFEAAYGTVARASYDGLAADERAEIDQIRQDIEADPYPDGTLKRRVELPPDLVLTGYVGHRWCLLYFIYEPGHIVIDFVAPADPLPWWVPR